MDAQYHVGGNLFLPDPETYGLAPERVSFARKLQPLLEVLDKRHLRRKRWKHKAPFYTWRVVRGKSRNHVRQDREEKIDARRQIQI